MATLNRYIVHEFKYNRNITKTIYKTIVNNTKKPKKNLSKSSVHTYLD